MAAMAFVNNRGGASEGDTKEIPQLCQGVSDIATTYIFWLDNCIIESESDTEYKFDFFITFSCTKFLKYVVVRT